MYTSFVVCPISTPHHTTPHHATHCIVLYRIVFFPFFLGILDADGCCASPLRPLPHTDTFLDNLSLSCLRCRISPLCSVFCISHPLPYTCVFLFGSLLRSLLPADIITLGHRRFVRLVAKHSNMLFCITYSSISTHVCINVKRFIHSLFWGGLNLFW